MTKANDPGDDDLLTAFHEGDKDAFKSICSIILPKLHSFVEEIVKSSDAADGIVAECLYKLFHFRSRLKSKNDVRLWLYLTARADCTNFLRNQEREEQKVAGLKFIQSTKENVQPATIKVFKLPQIDIELKTEIARLTEQLKNG